MKLKVLSYFFDVIKKPGFCVNKEGDNPKGDNAQVNCFRKEIKLDPEEKEVDASFIHEIIHIIECYWGLELKEVDIERLAQGFYHIMKENKFDFSGDEMVFGEKY